MATRLEMASEKIFKVLKEHRILSHTELQQVYRDNHASWNLPQSLSFAKFVEFAMEKGQLKKLRLEFPHRAVISFTWSDVALVDVIQAKYPKGYFSHLTAMQHHDLTEQNSTILCFNVEQQLTGGGTEPSQLGIDRAFKGKCRVTKNIVKVGEQSVRLLNGRNTGAMGVESIHDESPTQTRITNLERTLIDITVRPIYSGGVYMVALAFENAKHVSIPRLAKYLQRLNYTYPFQQAIGYYLDRTGRYSNVELQPIRELGVDYDFYLDYGLKKTDYVEYWRLHVPQGF